MRASTVRSFALGLPEVEERETWETATFRVRGKIFAMFSERERHVWVKSTMDEQIALTSMEPETYFVPPYVGPNGWIGVVLTTADRGEVEDMLTEAWRMTAPKRLVANADDGAA
jgi:hypothetical protein